MGTTAGPPGPAMGELLGSTPRVGIALLPVFNVPDRATIAYEALPRPALANPIAVARTALEATHYSQPAVLLVPFTGLLEAEDFSPAAMAAECGATPSEVAWIIAGPACRKDPDLVERRVGQLRADGFLIAIEAVGWATEWHHELVALQPDFLILDAGLIADLRDSVVARAELAGLISFTARLDIRLMTRGVDDLAIANAVTMMGLQYGSGAHLSPPLVLESELAVPGDKLVSPSWFRRHEARKLDRLGTATLVSTQLVALPEDDVADPGADLFAKTLGEAARLLQAEHDPARIVSVVADLLPRVMPMKGLAIFEADWDNDSLIPRVLAGADVVGLRDAPFPMSRGVTGWAFARGVPYNCANTVTHPAAGTIPGTDDQADESMLVIPLIAGDHRIGVLDLWRVGANKFSERDLEHCALFAHITAAAWHNAQLYREVVDRARTDALTGLHNTRWWDEVAPHEAARAVRSGTQIGVLLLDLDHFKLVNDSGGHAEGDRTLRNVARVLRSIVRTGDDVVRFGGEEFLILLHDSDAEGAALVAEDIRRAVADMPPPMPGVRVTASIGVAIFPPHGESLDDVVRAADLAMYRAKAQGRDCVVAAPLPLNLSAEAS
jgi:diguanylate cyclase (GGDEF)-like protein